MNDKLFAVRGVPVNTINIKGKSGTGKAISPEGIIDRLQTYVFLTFSNTQKESCHDN